MTAKKNSKRLYIINDIPLFKLDEIASLLPSKFGAYVDHRIKRDTCILVQEKYHTEAREYLMNELGYRVVLIEISEHWY